MLQINKKRKQTWINLLKTMLTITLSYYHFIKAIDPISLGHPVILNSCSKLQRHQKKFVNHKLEQV